MARVRETTEFVDHSRKCMRACDLSRSPLCCVEEYRISLTEYSPSVQHITLRPSPSSQRMSSPACHADSIELNTAALSSRRLRTENKVTSSSIRVSAVDSCGPIRGCSGPLHILTPSWTNDVAWHQASVDPADISAVSIMRAASLLYRRVLCDLE